MNVIILPGSGCAPTRSCNHYAWLERALIDRGVTDDVRSTTPSMPDADACRRHIWVPHREHDLRCDANTVIVGHSSGAACAMRVAARHAVRGIVLVAGTDDDSGDATERASGYFDDAFDYDTIASNCARGIECVIGARDSSVPAAMQLALAKKLGARARARETRDHFFTPPAEEIFDAVKRFL